MINTLSIHCKYCGSKASPNMNGSLFGKVYIQFSAQQNYGIPYVFPMVPSPSPPKKKKPLQVPQTFDHRKLQGEKPKEVSNPNTWEPAVDAVPHVQVRKDNSRNSHDEASGNWMVCNKWYGVIWVSACAIPKTGLFKQVLGFRPLVVLLLCFQITVFQWLGFRTITCFFRWCPRIHGTKKRWNNRHLWYFWAKGFFFGDREELHPKIR